MENYQEILNVLNDSNIRNLSTDLSEVNKSKILLYYQGLSNIYINYKNFLSKDLLILFHDILMLSYTIWQVLIRETMFVPMLETMMNDKNKSDIRELLNDTSVQYSTNAKTRFEQKVNDFNTKYKELYDLLKSYTETPKFLSLAEQKRLGIAARRLK